MLFLDFTQEKLELLESYMKAVKLFRSYEDPSEDPEYSEVISESELHFVVLFNPEKQLPLV